MIFVRGCFSSKKRLFESIAAFVVEKLHCENGEQACFECLFEREKLGNSGLGNGVAMPKAKLPATVSDKILTVFMQLETPVEYDAVDNKPVDIVLLCSYPKITAKNIFLFWQNSMKIN